MMLQKKEEHAWKIQIGSWKVSSEFVDCVMHLYSKVSPFCLLIIFDQIQIIKERCLAYYLED